MKTTIRFILRHVVSGDVQLTPRLLVVLNELNQDQPATAAAKKPEHVSERAAKQLQRETVAKKTNLTFISPLPGRWIRQT
jgi:hypothetical protein